VADASLRVHGLREFMRATAKADKETKKVVREKLREAGDVVREDAANRLARIDSYSASKLRTRAKVGGVFVEQSLRKVTGLRPDYGQLQMRKALEPAVEAKAGEVEQRLEKAVDELADIMERG